MIETVHVNYEAYSKALRYRLNINYMSPERIPLDTRREDLVYPLEHGLRPFPNIS